MDERRLLTVEEETTLLPFLLLRVKDKSRNTVKGLLFPAEFVEVDGISRNPDGQVGIFVRMLIGIHQCFPVEDVDIDMVGHLGKIAV